MDLATKLNQILETEILPQDLFLVDLIVNKKSKLRISIFLDGDNGVDIDNCARVSRKLSAIIEERNLIDEAFVLDVSSPGADKPLKLWRQYPKHINRKLQVNTQEGTQVVGLLKAVTDQNLTIEVAADKKKKSPAQELQLEKSQVVTSVVLIEF